MGELLIGESLKFSETNTATRYGELVTTKENIYNIPTPRLGMRVYVSSEGKEYIIRSLLPKTINGVEVPDAAVGEFEPSDGDITAVNAELLKRIQGTSDETDARKDPFKYIKGDKTDVNFGTSFTDIGALEKALNGLTYENKDEGYKNFGYFRANIGHRQFEIKNLLISSTRDYFVQVVSGCLEVRKPNDGGILLAQTDDIYSIVARVRKGKDENNPESSWGEWQTIISTNSINDLKKQIKTLEESIGDDLGGTMDSKIEEAIKNLIGDSGYESLKEIKEEITAEVNRATAKETDLQQQIDYIDYVKSNPIVSIGGVDNNGNLTDQKIFCHTKLFKGKFLIETKLSFIISHVYDKTDGKIITVTDTKYTTQHEDHFYIVVIRHSSLVSFDPLLNGILNGDLNNTINFFGQEKLAEIKADIANNTSSIVTLNNEVATLNDKIENLPESGGGDGVPSETITEIQERLDNIEGELSNTKDYVDEKIKENQEENQKAITDLKDGSSYTMKGLEKLVQGHINGMIYDIGNVQNNIKEVENSLYNHINVKTEIGKLTSNGVDEGDRYRIYTEPLTGNLEIIFSEYIYISEYKEYDDDDNLVSYQEYDISTDDVVSSITINTNNHVQIGGAFRDGNPFRTNEGWITFAGISKFDAINNKIGISVNWDGEKSLNDFKDQGEYIINGIRENVNDGMPDIEEGTINAKLTVISQDNIVLQKLTIINATNKYGSIFLRTYNGSAWGDWRNIGVSSGSSGAPVDLKTLQDRVGKLEEFAPENIEWNGEQDIDNYIEDGIYNISGTKTTEDGLPILNNGVIKARLAVLVADNCVTQSLTLLNVAGGESNIYIRTRQNDTWKPWGKLQTNVEVGLIDQSQMDSLVDNGIYSGILSTTGETFVIICINNYAIAQQVGVQHISHLKYSLVVGTGEIKIEKRTRDAYGFWTEWENIGGGSTLPVATTETIGGVRLGTNTDNQFTPLVNISNNGTGVGIKIDSNCFVNVNAELTLKLNHTLEKNGAFEGIGVALGTSSLIRNVIPCVLGSDITDRYSIGMTKGFAVGIPYNIEQFSLKANGLNLKEGIGAEVTKVTWDASSNMNDFKTPGVYEIYGERTVKTDNLPIMNDGSGHSIAARLTVVASTLQPNNTEICITQFLQLSNRIGGEGNMYVRTYNENNNSMNGWTPWQKQMGMVETLINNNNATVGQEVFSGETPKIGDGLNGMIDNGMYSGIYTDALIECDPSLNLYCLYAQPTFVETFVLIVINDYAASGKLGMQRHITQLKYAIDAITGQSTVKKRVGTGSNTISWGDWEDVGGGVDVTTIPVATTETSGLMSAEDKKSLDTATSRALRTLFVAVGAEYNDTGANITKTAPWGETVTHKAGHYYLNGLGDITEAQMMKIYNRGAFNDSEKSPLGYSTNNLNIVRTNLCRVGMWNGSLLSYLCTTNTIIEVLNLHITNSNILKDTCSISFPDTESLFNGASRLSVIDTRCLLSSSTWKDTSFNGCKKLKEVRIKSLKNNIVFKDSSILSKATVLYMIQKAAPTTAITITLHSDAYARLAEDADIVSALEAQPLITLVSA